ncbi:MAG: hypothetical protein ABI573_04910 [Chloroflexota bacterium]
MKPASIPANTYSSDGFFYVHVTGKNGAYDLGHKFQLTVASTGACAGVASIGSAPGPIGSTAQTVILWDSTRISGTSTEKSTLASKLATLATATGGVVVDIGTPGGRIAQLNAQADLPANVGCVYAKNLVASAIRDVVQSYRNAALQYVVLVGGDSTIPFFRYPDPSDLAPESWYVPPVKSNSPSETSLRSKFVLGQDEYGADTVLSLGGTRFPVPDLAVGRLVETASEASTMIDAYLGLSGSAVTPSRSLVTGYDFIADSAAAVQGQLSTGMLPSATTDSLINNGWTANQLRTYMLGATHYDLMYLAGHFDANSLLAADFSTTINASELAAPTVNLSNTLVWSTGCHAGYSLVDGDGISGVTQTLDWAQALARKGATLVAGTGFQYGDDALIEYSERIYTEFAHQLRVGTGAVSVGSALVKSKLAYLAATPDIKGMHEKALLTAALFGLPMFSVNMPGSRDTSATGASIVPSTSTGGIGVKYADVNVNTGGTTPHTATGVTPNASYLSGPDGTSSNPGEPALPRFVNNVGVGGQVLRGVGFRGGVFTETTGVTPLMGAPGTEFGGTQAPFSSTTFFPSRMWTASYFGDLGSGSTSLVLTPAQHKVTNVGDTTATRRAYANLDLRLFYADAGDTAAGKATAPTISNVTATVSGSIVSFSTTVLGKDAAGVDNVKNVWVTYTFGNAGCHCWKPIDLTRSVSDPTVWTGQLDLSGANGGAGANLRFILQAANGAALVGTADNAAAYFSLTTTAAPNLATSSLTINAPAINASGIYGATATVSATLMSGAVPLVGRTVVLRLGTAIQSAVTDVNGLASAALPLQDTPGATQTAAIYAGDATTGPSNASRAFSVAKLGTGLTLTTPLSGVSPGDESGVFATLKDANNQPLSGRSIIFVVGDVTHPGIARQVSTGFDGRAALGPVPALPAGGYAVSAFYSGTVTLDPWAGSPSTIVLTDPIYEPSAVGGSVLVNRIPGSVSITNVPAQLVFGTTFAPSFTILGDGIASATSSTPSICTVNGAGVVTPVGIGTCSLVPAVTQGTNYLAATGAAQSFQVVKPVTLGFTGNRFWSAGTGTSANVTFTGQITASATPAASLTNASIDFLVFASTNAGTTPNFTCHATVNSSGVATCTRSLTLDSWTMIMQVTPGSPYFTAPNSDPAVVTVYQTSTGRYATGAGWVVDPSYQNLPVAVSSTNRNGVFGFAVSYKGTSTTPIGTLTYAFRGADGYNYLIGSTSWTNGGLAFGTGTAGFSGQAKVTVINPLTGKVVAGLGGTGYTFRADVKDGSPDKFALRVFTSNGALYHQVGTTASQIAVSGGSIIVH